MSTTAPRLSTPYNRNMRNQDTRNRNALQSYILLGLGVIFLLGAQFLQLSSKTYPIGLFLFGFGLLIAAIINPRQLVISGLFFTLVGAAFFLGFRKIILFDNSLLIIAISIALLGIALMARKGYVGVGALTPGLFVLLVGIIQYPAVGLGPKLAPFVLSLWFPGTGLLILGLAYWLFRNRRA